MRDSAMTKTSVIIVVLDVDCKWHVLQFHDFELICPARILTTFLADVRTMFLVTAVYREIAALGSA